MTDDSMFFIESFRKLSYNVDTLSFGRIDNIWVKKDSIKTLLISNRGQFNRSDYQYGDVAYEVVNFNGKIKKLPFKEIQGWTPIINLKLKEKGKNTRNILGYECKEYVYYYEMANSIRVTKVWIPDEFKSKEWYRNGKFFQSYFFPDGLPFRYESYDDKNTLTSSSELINIIKYDVPDAEFEECIVSNFIEKQ